MVDTKGKPYQMNCVIHYGNDSDKYLKEFNRKKAMLLRECMRELNEIELKRLYEMLENMKKDM